MLAIKFNDVILSPVINAGIQAFLLVSNPMIKDEIKINPAVIPVSFQRGLESIHPINIPANKERIIRIRNLLSGNIISVLFILKNMTNSSDLNFFFNRL